MGKRANTARRFAELLQEGTLKENIDTLFMGFIEAEAVKLFSTQTLTLSIDFVNKACKSKRAYSIGVLFNSSNCRAFRVW